MSTGTTFTLVNGSRLMTKLHQTKTGDNCCPFSLAVTLRLDQLGQVCWFPRLETGLFDLYEYQLSVTMTQGSRGHGKMVPGITNY